MRILAVAGMFVVYADAAPFTRLDSALLLPNATQLSGIFKRNLKVY